MTHHLGRTLALGAALCALAAGSALAQGKGHGKAKGQEKHATVVGGDVVADQRDVPPGIAKKGGVPPGLAKKPGGMPPGQYKKRYDTNTGAGILRDVFVQRGYTVTRLVPSGTSQYVYYRLPDGSERRAVVRPGERLTFVNVPAAILQEVVARLY